MQPRHLYPAALIAVIVVLGGTAFSKGLFSGGATYRAPVAEVTNTTTTSGTLEGNTSAGNGVSATNTSAPLPEQTSGTVPATDSYTLADVAQHATKDSCWTAVNGEVYDLTSFIPAHPGGERILAICGIDGTSAFEAQHGSNNKAQSELVTHKIGVLAN